MRARYSLQSRAMLGAFGLCLLPLFVVPSGCSRGGASGDDPGKLPGNPQTPLDLAMPMPDLKEPKDAAVESKDSSVDPQRDAGTEPDGGGRDMSGPVVDLASPPDLSTPRDLAMPPDMAFASGQDVDIYVDNFCRMDVVPKKFDVPAGTSLKLTYHNRSRDYPVDVWLSYGGGFRDLMPGMTWADRFEFCRYPRPYMAYADISTACSRYRLMINCL